MDSNVALLLLVLVHTGVPQSSVIGALLFNLYSSDPETIAQRHNLSFHQYADDTQLYSSCVPGETEQLQNRLSDCVDEMAAWMESNVLNSIDPKLKLYGFLL